MRQQESAAQRQMLHIRLPHAIHVELRALAASRGVPLQRLAEGALRDALAAATVPSEAGLGAVFPDRHDKRLATRVDELLAVAPRFDLAGVTLLDFLSEEGWGHPPVSEALLERGCRARLAIADRDALATRVRFATTYGFSADDDEALRGCAKYLQLEYAEKLLAAFAATEDVEAGRYSLAPSWRWILLSEDAVLAEPHLPRLRDEHPVSTALMPVFEFHPASPAGERLREHFENLWRRAA